ncbi:response regulator, partial [Cobetia marina]
MKLLLLEDDDLLAESLAELLEDNGYRLDVSSNLNDAQAFMATEQYALAILDLGLPDGSGLDLLKRWRQGQVDIPILILTARDTWEDKVVGLRSGADDYLTKPFHEAELLARLHALLRRRQGASHGYLQVSGIQLDEEAQRVCCDGEQWASLTATEFR